MAIYIEGIDLPTYIQGCRILVVYADGVVENYASEIVGKAFTVQKHGRLIDADVLMTHLVPDGGAAICVRIADVVIPEEMEDAL